MTRRVCIVELATDMLGPLVNRLSPDMKLVATMEAFDKAWSIARFEGPGLPEWCEEPSHGASFAKATVWLGGDGVVRFNPLPPIQNMQQSPQQSNVEWFNKQFGGRN